MSSTAMGKECKLAGCTIQYRFQNVTIYSDKMLFFKIAVELFLTVEEAAEKSEWDRGLIWPQEVLGHSCSRNTKQSPLLVSPV